MVYERVAPPASSLFASPSYPYMVARPGHWWLAVLALEAKKYVCQARRRMTARATSHPRGTTRQSDGNARTQSSAGGTSCPTLSAVIGVAWSFMQPVQMPRDATKASPSHCRSAQLCTLEAGLRERQPGMSVPDVSAATKKHVCQAR